MRSFSQICHSLVILLCLSETAYAGAWTQQSGNGLLILNNSYYSASHFVNNAGKRQKQALYQKYEINPYVEYGLTDDVTLGFNAFLQYITQNSTQTVLVPPSTVITVGGTQHNFGIGDIELFARRKLWDKDGLVVSAEPMFKLPALADSGDAPAVGNHHPNAGLTLSGGYGFSAWGQNHFVNLDTGYRYRFGKQKDQIQVNATAGFGVAEGWMVMPQLFIIRRTGSPAASSTFAETPSNDYNLTKLMLSVVHNIDALTSVQVGGFSHVDARNSSLGGGGLISLWRKF